MSINFNPGHSINPFTLMVMQSQEVREEIESMASAGYSGEEIVEEIGQTNLNDLNDTDKAILEQEGIHLFNYEA